MEVRQRKAKRRLAILPEIAVQKSSTMNSSHIRGLPGDPEIAAKLYCNFAYPYWEGYVVCSIYLR